MQSRPGPAPILLPVSHGELLDKKTILEIKSERFQDAQQLVNVRHELTLLTSAAEPFLQSIEVRALEQALKVINSKLWDLENAVRACERSGMFDGTFISTARKIYAGNDERAAVKRKINLLLNSSIVEEKSHR